MGFGGGNSSSGSSATRYAPYLESIHQDFLTSLRTDVDMLYHNTPRWTSPYSNHVFAEVEDAFFGAGYTIASFPSLYDMYGKFMAGLDIEALYGQIFEDTVNSPQINNLVAAEGALIDDEININSIPRLETGMRDINSVMSSTFITSKALIEEARTKSISKFSADLKYRMIPLAQDRWAKHLDWNRNIVALYGDIMKLYYASKTEVNESDYSFAARDLLWPFTVYEYERAAIGTLQGAVTTKTNQKENPGLLSTLGTLGGIAGIASLFL